ncbi:MAG: excinuclease ABC subunit UvrC [Chitinophagales bacterium]|nr:excinuclease ABC subunit UvrC [Hyphomicrobiales bacterium]
MPDIETTDKVDTTPDETQAGPQVIAGYLKHLGTGAGVYRMIDARGDVIYVGKARNLKARVSNYARGTGHSNRIARMIALTTAMEFVSTPTESEALLLEANFIKRYKPPYNVLMRDDKSFPYIVISREHATPQLMKHRGARTMKGDYFGPFASAGAVNRTLNMMQRAFLLRSCSDHYYESRTRPCLLHQIKRCSAPCTGEIEPQEYSKLVDEAVRFLQGKTDAVQKKLNALMAEASEALEFERAAVYRNRLWALAHVQATQGINPHGIDEADLFAAYQDGGQTCIQVFFFRNGQNWGNHAYYPKADRSLAVEEVLEPFIAQFYDDRPVPRCVLLSHDFPERALLAEALCIKIGRKVDVAVPLRGEKRAIVEHALTNAREALGRKLAEASSHAKLMEGVAAAFGLPRTPRRIEVYDNSHIMGTNAVGAMIVAGPEGLMKSQYRKFNIKSKTLTPGDDFGMMREVLTRRFSRLVKARGGNVKESAESRHCEERSDEAIHTLQEPSGLLRSARKYGDPSLPPGDGEANGAVQYDAVDAEAPALTEPDKEREFSPSLPGLTRQASLRTLGALDPRIKSGDDGLGASRDEVGALGAEEPVETSGDDKGEGFEGWPDIVFIDGGAGQLSAAQGVLDALKVKGVTLAGIAKGPERNAGREHFFVAGRQSFMLEPRDPVLYFVQRLRDEAHRFVIGAHRAKRSKAIGVNPLDEIKGIGAMRKRALLKHFGSAKSVARAGVADLQAVEGVSAAMAQAIYDFFHERRS